MANDLAKELVRTDGRCRFMDWLTGERQDPPQPPAPVAADGDPLDDALAQAESESPI